MKESTITYYSIIGEHATLRPQICRSASDAQKRQGFDLSNYAPMQERYLTARTRPFHWNQYEVTHFAMSFGGPGGGQKSAKPIPPERGSFPLEYVPHVLVTSFADMDAQP